MSGAFGHVTLSLNASRAQCLGGALLGVAFAAGRTLTGYVEPPHIGATSSLQFPKSATPTTHPAIFRPIKQKSLTCAEIGIAARLPDVPLNLENTHCRPVAPPEFGIVPILCRHSGELLGLSVRRRNRIKAITAAWTEGFLTFFASTSLSRHSEERVRKCTSRQADYRRR